MEDVNMRQPLVHGSSQQSLTLAFIKRMYVGHFLARWGARMWEFSVGLYMINLWPDSLLFTAIYGVVESSSTALFGSVVGKWVDRLTYAKVLKLWLLTQNLSFIVAGVTVTALLTCYNLKSTSFSTFLSFVIIVNLSGAIGVLSTLAGTILIEREWVVVIANGQPAGVLTEMNSTIRRIDLILWLQYWLLTSVYNGIPALINTDEQRKAKPITSNLLENESYFNENTSFAHLHWWNRIPEMLSKIPFLDAWILYSKQQVVLPGVSLALLYFTVLSFGTLMTATLQWKGIPAYIIGLARGFSAIVGISATMIYPIVHSHISTLRTGLWSIWTQWSFLLLCLASIWIKNNGVSAWMLMGGVAASRLGLWMFDLSVIQQMQDEVPESDRCIVGGAQNSLQSMLDLLTYIMGIIVSNPEEFGKLVIMSFVLVSSAALLYTLHVYQVRKHLFHFEKFLKV
ncbi:solute carrier family 40 member 1 isoform X3 [Dioscorea cayenensis subsp. rotundata]|uniref:Solute carrier family 40 member n=1 Tax=Dioscorea cayennensis subsp. rotundata TaxID=55577 RepID=A0AB40CB46_DIOCR|nr:solute carrier family 40 member 1 isoform X3 [Dioscorea cayenensis subsp. rotundata]